MSTQKVPDSYLAYCHDSAVQTAIDHIFENANKKRAGLPQDLSWEDLPKFYRAVLSAYQVGSEYAIFMVCLWDEIWKTALDEKQHDLDLTPLGLTHNEAIEYPYSITERLTNKFLDRVFKVSVAARKFDLWLRVTFELDQLKLNLYLYDDMKNDVGVSTIELDKTLWKWDEDLEGYDTSKSVASINDEGLIDVGEAQKIAKEALNAIAKAVKS